MATVIGILCSISVFFIDSVEMADPPAVQANPPNVIQLYNVHHYEDLGHYWNSRGEEGPIAWLHSGHCLMGRDARFQYIIGRLDPITYGLQPLLGRREDIIGDRLGSVKIRIDGNIANVTAPISRKSPVFRNHWRDDYVVLVNVNGPQFR